MENLVALVDALRPTKDELPPEAKAGLHAIAEHLRLQFDIATKKS